MRFELVAIIDAPRRAFFRKSLCILIGGQCGPVCDYGLFAAIDCRRNWVFIEAWTT